MKTLKLIGLVILLIVANLYILISVSFEIKYRALIDDYSKLSVEYHELYNKYVAQEEKLQTIMAYYEEDKSVPASLNKILNLSDKGVKYFYDKIKNLEWRNIIETINLPITN